MNDWMMNGWMDECIGRSVGSINQSLLFQERIILIRKKLWEEIIGKQFKRNTHIHTLQVAFFSRITPDWARCCQSETLGDN